jgi:phosphatidylglycerophosphatase A
VAEGVDRLGLWQDASVPASSTDPSPSTSPKRPPLWATVIATAGGAGLSPVAPGTCGTLVAIPLAWALARSGIVVFAAATLVVSVIGIIASSAFCKATGVDDDQRIVIDEVAGYLVTILLVPHSWVNLAIGFFVFRLFDIWKPGPIRLVDERVHGGLGVMLDDLAAGVVGALVMLGLHAAGVDAWLLARVHG